MNVYCKDIDNDDILYKDDICDDSYDIEYNISDGYPEKDEEYIEGEIINVITYKNWNINIINIFNIL